MSRKIIASNVESTICYLVKIQFTFYDNILFIYQFYFDITVTDICECYSLAHTLLVADIAVDNKLVNNIFHLIETA